jgi:hypothetical protein
MPTQPSNNESNNHHSASGRLSALLIASSPTPQGRARILDSLNMLSNLSAPPEQIELAVQVLGAHVRGLSEQQRQEVRNLYYQAQGELMHRIIEGNEQADDNTRFRIRNARLVMESGGLIPTVLQEQQRPPTRTYGEIRQPGRIVPPNPPSLQENIPTEVVEAASLVTGGHEVTTVALSSLPQALGPFRHV